MIRAAPIRIPLTEYAWSDTALTEAASRSLLSVQEVASLLASASARIKTTLGLSDPPVRISGRSVMVGDVAGILRLSPRLELEVAPKFLGSDSDRWREDFVLLAGLSKSGRMFSRELVGASRGPRSDLASLLARSMASLFWEQHRRPLRTYKRRRLEEFAFDGEVDLESLFPPEESGFRQDRIVFNHRNHFNATIAAAARALSGEAWDPSTRRQLERLCHALGPQDPVRWPRPERLPSRHRHWQELYDLSCQVLAGFGLRLSEGGLRAPGYVVNCWRVWEDLLRRALKVGLADRRVSTVSYTLGIRTIRGTDADRSNLVSVTPDISIGGSADSVCLVDAKYKSRTGEQRTRIVESDLYEALAFLTATRTQRIVLAYPRPAKGKRDLELGSVRESERVEVNEKVVLAAEVEVRGISEVGGFRRFSQNLSRSLDALFKSPALERRGSGSR